MPSHTDPALLGTSERPAPGRVPLPPLLNGDVPARTELAGSPAARRPEGEVTERPELAGKFLAAAGRKLHVKGVTYGTFGENSDGNPFPEPETVRADFAAMAAAEINALRTYTVPPRWLLDMAAEQGLRVMVGLPWEQHVTFLDDRGRRRSIERRVREGVRACASHPAVLCYSIGNEIPASIVRWHGPRRVERFLERLYNAAKDEDPEGLVTYVNFPSTEYLELPFVDVFSFNVYLEAQRPLQRYLARLQNLAGDRPLLMAEIGLDSRRNGVDEQARVLDWQVATAFESGCAGTFVFAWTDEWHRGGHEIDDWDFGLTTRAREPKPALAAVRAAYDRVPVRDDAEGPPISVVVCTCNGARTLRDCLEGVLELDYPDFEVIVVDDGSTDGSVGIAAELGVRTISTENRGLAAARNTGMRAATGEIVAYLDDDARPDRDWLTHLAHAFTTGDHAAVGGPNIAPPDDGPIADCVAHAPGGPIHVLVTDELAEHLPGCNLAIRRERLRGIGGFDPQFRAAGDDVDVCWRLQERGWTLGFSAAAMVWHKRRNSVRAYWRQQRAYGKAEALLERKWPERYNSAGHISWGGRLYGHGLTQPLTRRRGRIRYGTWGTGLFQSVYQPAAGTLGSLTLMPEWYLLMVALAALSLLGLAWPPLLVALPLLAVAAAPVATQAVRGALGARFPAARRTLTRRAGLRCLTAVLHLVQPQARLAGRLREGLVLWRRRAGTRLSVPTRRAIALWSEGWRAPEEWVGLMEGALLAAGARVRRGGECDRWDVEVRGGLLGGARARGAVEEHGAGRQLVRFRVWPRPTPLSIALMCAPAGAAAVAAATDSPAPGAVLAALGLGLAARAALECGRAIGALRAGAAAVEAAAAVAPDDEVA